MIASDYGNQGLNLSRINLAMGNSPHGTSQSNNQHNFELQTVIKEQKSKVINTGQTPECSIMIFNSNEKDMSKQMDDLQNQGIQSLDQYLENKYTLGDDIDLEDTKVHLAAPVKKAPEAKKISDR